MSQSDFYRGVEAAGAALEGAPADAAAGAAAVHAALEPLLRGDPARRACGRGCAHCCHLPVQVTFGEALQLAAAAAADAALGAAVRDAAAATANLPDAALAGRPCPFLRDHACAAYAVRPLPCRALASADATACATALHGRAVVPVDAAAFFTGLGAAAALAEAATPPGQRELRAAVAALLAAAPDGASAAFAHSRALGGD